MKTIPSLLLIAFLSIPLLSAQQNSDFYRFSAQTAKKGKSDDKYKDSSGVTVRTTTRAQAVDTDLFFSRGPSAEYSVQCFFIAKDEDTDEMFIYDAQQQKVEGDHPKFSFHAPDLTGTIKRSISIPVNGTTTSGEFVSGSLYFSSTTKGSKISGWIVRLIADGKTVRIETNQHALEQLASRNSPIFDAAFEEQK